MSSLDLSKLPGHIFGLHDTGGEQLFRDAGKSGWLTVSVALKDSPQGDDFSAQVAAGCGLIVRLNFGYESVGTLPPQGQYDAFAQMCAIYVAGSRGANIWVIGNETNLAAEWPTVDELGHRQALTPDLVAQCFARCARAIKNVPGHSGDWVIPSPPGPWNAQTTYPGNDKGDWVQYFQDILTKCAQAGTPPDGIALHTYTHGTDAALIANETLMDFTPARRFNFRTYKDFLAAVPQQFRALPVFITETQAIPWTDSGTGWIPAAYGEINAWNADPAHQPIQALCLFRWQNSGSPDWIISTRSALVDDLRLALQHDYRVRWPNAPVVITPPPATKQPSKEGWCPFATRRTIADANYEVGRAGQTVRAVVLHIAEKALRQIAPAYSNAAALTSAHFAIGKDGTIEQYVSIRDTALANGLGPSGTQWFTRTNKPVSPSWPDIVPGMNPNRYTISVEHEGFPSEPWTQPMFAANNRLLQWITSQTGLTYLPHHTLIGHSEIDPIEKPNCPGPQADVDRIAFEANGGLDAAAEAAMAAAKALPWLAINQDGALYKFAQRNKFGCPLTAEFKFTFNADPFVGQVFEQKIVYAKFFDWNNIQKFDVHPAVPPVGDAGAEALAAAGQLELLAVVADSALRMYAQTAGLGCPQTAEFSFTVETQSYTGQVFKGGVAYFKTGDAASAKYIPKVFVAAITTARPIPWLPINTDSALFKFAQRTSLTYPQTGEFEIAIGGVPYIIQVYPAAIVYVVKGDFGNVKSLAKNASAATLADPIMAGIFNSAQALPLLAENPDAFLYKYAQQAALGYPQTSEFDFKSDETAYVAQVFNQGIVYLLKGDTLSTRWLTKPTRL